MSRTKTEGDRGEAATAAWVESHGGTILDRQWRCRQGELDLVARARNGTVCFVEVKLRSPRSSGLPREAVDERKRARLRAAAELYLSERGIDAPARFDVAEVYAEDDGTLRVEYLADAFT